MPPNPSPSTQQIRAINRMFADIVRTDWRYPEQPSHNTASTRVGAVQLTSRVNPFLDAKDRDPVEYRERYFSTSEDEALGSDFDESDEAEDEENRDATEEGMVGDVQQANPVEGNDGGKGRSQSPEAQKNHKRQKSAKFETPDSVGPYTERRFRALNRRNMKRLESEIAWNSGLSLFMRRRNAWTKAVSREEAIRRTEDRNTFSLGTPEQEAVAMNGIWLGLPAHGITPDIETTDLLSRTEPQSFNLAEEKSSMVQEQKTTLPDPPADPTVITNVFIPISPPIVPSDHPVRANILARSDQELYDKLVKDSRTPAVPVNLAHMMRIIVQGWKDEGNWPPKPGVPDSSLSMSRKMKDSLNAGTAHGAQSEGGSKVAGYLSNHPRVKQGVESFKRVLRLSSGSNNPDGSKPFNDTVAETPAAGGFQAT